MPAGPVPPDVRRFIVDHIHSVAQLELLLLLHRDPDVASTAEGVGREMRYRRVGRPRSSRLLPGPPRRRGPPRRVTVLLSVLDDQSEARTAVCLARAIAFGLIALAVLDKNWPRGRCGEGP